MRSRTMKRPIAMEMDMKMGKKGLSICMRVRVGRVECVCACVAVYIGAHVLHISAVGVGHSHSHIHSVVGVGGDTVGSRPSFRIDTKSAATSQQNYDGRCARVYVSGMLDGLRNTTEK